MILPIGEPVDTPNKEFVPPTSEKKAGSERRVLLYVTILVLLLMSVAVMAFRFLRHEPPPVAEVTEVSPEARQGFPEEERVSLTQAAMLETDSAALSVEECNRMGRKARDAGRHEDAIRLFQLSQQKVEAGAEGEILWDELASSLATLGHLCFDRTPEDYVCAREYYTQALEIARAQNLAEDPRYEIVSKRLQLCQGMKD